MAIMVGEMKISPTVALGFNAEEFSFWTDRLEFYLEWAGGKDG